MWETLINVLGEKNLPAVAGILIGLAFGIVLQRTDFCMRAGVVDVFAKKVDERLIIWLIGFVSAIIFSQSFIGSGWLDIGNSQVATQPGAISGAIIGGLVFGVGMILARGCPVRNTVLACSGNLRSLITLVFFVIFAVITQTGIVAPIRIFLANLITIEPHSRILFSGISGISVGILILIAVVALGYKTEIKIKKSKIIGASAVGLIVALAWLVNYQIAQNTFVDAPIKGITFTGPYTDMALTLMHSTFQKWNFDIGLIIGVIIGAFSSALLFKEFKVEGFRDDKTLTRYILGASLMAFGGILAGGCTVGVGLTGFGVFSVTAILALCSMWLSAGITHLIIDQKKTIVKNQNIYQNDGGCS